MPRTPTPGQTLARLLAATALTASPGAWAALDPVPAGRLAPELRCQLGVYTLPGPRTLRLTGADGAPRVLRYTWDDGRFGNLQERADGAFVHGALTLRLQPCASQALHVDTGSGARPAVRLGLVETPSRFTSDGIVLHGKLVAPAGVPAAALAVWIEGSNHNPSTDDSVWPYELARRGVAVFVYDKRGTGASAGAPTADLEARARDTAAAVREARRLAPGVRHVGVIGASQGGWVAPLVGQLETLDFMVAAFAMAEGPIAQDQALVAQALRESGFAAAAGTEARELTALTERIVRSGLREGLAELDAFKARHAGAAWLQAIAPRSYTGLFLRFSSAQILADGPALAQGLRFDFEPMPVIRRIGARQLWLLAGSDRQAPSAGTQAVLRALQQQRQDVAVVVFPDADHGLVEPATAPAEPGQMAYAAGAFDTAADWILRGALPGTGRFITFRPR